jgi:hypothetical protein
MFGWLSKLLIGAGSKLKPSTAADMLKKAGIENMDDLAKFSKKEILNKLGLTKKSGIISKGIKTGTVAGAGAYGKDVYDRMNKGGMVKMKRGGSVKKRAKSSSKKSRGTGAAIKGTKFKGVF